jgi:hypothetical protein
VDLIDSNANEILSAKFRDGRLMLELLKTNKNVFETAKKPIVKFVHRLLGTKYYIKINRNFEGTRKLIEIEKLRVIISEIKNYAVIFFQILVTQVNKSKLIAGFQTQKNILGRKFGLTLSKGLKSDRLKEIS